MINRSEQWYVDQYNRNREKKDWVSSFTELQQETQKRLWRTNQK